MQRLHCIGIYMPMPIPTVYVDKTGKYAEAGHYYTTYYVALRYQPEEAQKLAFYSQLPDEADRLDAIGVEANALASVPKDILTAEDGIRTTEVHVER